MINCASCGLANQDTDAVCARCGAPLKTVEKRLNWSRVRRTLTKSFIRVVGLAALLLFLGYLSLITSSDPISFQDREIVDRAITVLERKGFGTDAFMLRHLVRYRSTDNWWNKRVGHDRAYAATNFPFEVVTLYPQFFKEPVDDTERAAILLHEAYHLRGYGEEVATERSWRDKRQLGWTRELYAGTSVWASVKEYTVRFSPHMFECGPDGRSDCFE